MSPKHRLPRLAPPHSLMAFLKCVELPTVKLLVGNGQPLMLETALAAADSKMTFVQGPQM